MDPGTATIFTFLAVAIVVTVVVTSGYIIFGRLWFLAQAEGAPVPLTRILALAVRKAPVANVVGAYIDARKAGFDVTFDRMEEVALFGGDVRAIVDAMRESAKAGGSLTFDEACTIELKGKHAVTEAQAKATNAQ